MKPQSALERLAEGLPLYTSLAYPFLDRSIIGTETEFGYENSQNPMLPGFTENGGRLYIDNGHHPEWATPETRSPLAATVYEKAGELIAQEYVDCLYKNIVDNNDFCWGSHENYYSILHPEKLEPLAPFLASRQIYAGAGRWKNKKYTIAQRAPFIWHLKHQGTQDKNRGIICTKNEQHMENPNRYRIHLILGDSNRCPVATWLKLGTTALLIRLLEERKLPIIPYDKERIVEDLHTIAHQQSGWEMRCIKPDIMSAIAVQRIYYAAAHERFHNHNEQVRDLLEIWDDTLTWLERDPSKLERRIDWVAKKRILSAYQNTYSLDAVALDIESLDNTYHLVGIHKGLPTFDQFHHEGFFEKLVPDDMVEAAIRTPPANTRAYGRGLMVQYGKQINYDIGNNGLIDWNRGIFFNEQRKLVSCSMGEPFSTYSQLAAKLKHDLASTSRAVQLPSSKKQGRCP